MKPNHAKFCSPLQYVEPASPASSDVDGFPQSDCTCTSKLISHGGDQSCLSARQNNLFIYMMERIFNFTNSTAEGREKMSPHLNMFIIK
uniref:Uncharacterized protein n=1 Tax=Heterorhabditis bacteriophora TaxID=37862 RepID=A0A1I7WK62_HETBA